MPAARKIDWASYISASIVIAYIAIEFLLFNPSQAFQIALGVVAVALVALCVARLSIAPALLFLRGVVPLAIGGIFVATYIKVHQPDSVLGVDLGDIFGNNLTDLLMLAQFNPEYKEQFYTAIATLFAIILALALVNGIRDIEKAKSDVAAEIGCVRSAMLSIEYFEDDELADKPQVLAAKKGIQSLLPQYLVHCGTGRDFQRSGENTALLAKCQRYIMDLEPFDDDDEMAKRDLVHKLDELAMFRMHRIAFFSRGSQPLMQIALWLMALAMILPFLAEPICVDPPAASPAAGRGVAQAPSRAAPAPQERKLTFAAIERDGIRCASPQVPNSKRFSQYYMIFVLASFLSFMMLMLHDVGSASGGFWNVDLSEFEQAARELRVA